MLEVKPVETTLNGGKVLGEEETLSRRGDSGSIS